MVPHSRNERIANGTESRSKTNFKWKWKCCWGRTTQLPSSIGTRLVPAKHGAVDVAALLGLSAAAEDDIDQRPSHHEMEGEEDHDHDDFEKDEIVKMAEPSSTKKRKNMAERQTKESSHGENGSDNNSLLREISARNKLEAVKGSSSMPPTGKLI